MFNSVLFVIIFSDKEDCYLTSVLSTLKNENPITIHTDQTTESKDNEKACKKSCSSKCYGYIYFENNCFTYIYMAEGNAPVYFPSTELKHKGR